MNEDIEKAYDEFIKKKAKPWIEMWGKETDGYGVPVTDLMIDDNPFECFKAGVEYGRKAK